MAVLRMDNVAIVVDDLQVGIDFFSAIGLELQGSAEIEGPWADQTVGLNGVRSKIAMMVTPDGHSKVELTEYVAPPAVDSTPNPPPANTIGLHRLMFTVDDIDATIDRLAPLGGRALGSIAQYEDLYRLCYLRGPSGIIVALAQPLKEERSPLTD